MKSKNKFLGLVAMLLTLTFDFFILRPLKAIGAGLSAFSNAMGTPGGVLANVWTANQNCDAPTSSGTQSVAAAGTAALNKEEGIITLTGFNAAAAATQIATITNTTCLAGSIVTATLVNYAGTWNTNGQPWLAQVDTLTTPGSMIFRIVNLHAANALAGNITVHFVVHQVIV